MVGDPVSTSGPNDLQPGRVLVNRYELVRLAGSGGMAQVWEATDRVLGRRVAIKLLHNHLASAASIARFRQEGVAAAKLIHPNVVSIFDTIPVDNTEALVMEFVEGHTLRAHLDRHRSISEQDTRHIGVAISEALAAAHRQGLVHRDVKPANILLCKNGQVKITDFGIAKAAEIDCLTREGTLVGTAAYLAPEQLDGSQVDGRADIYALGLVLYECLAGRQAFSGDTDAAVALARLRTDATDLLELNQNVSGDLAAIIRTTMARNPQARYQNALDLKNALLERPRPTAPSPASAGAPTATMNTAERSADTRVVDEDDLVEAGYDPNRRRWMVPVAVLVFILISVLIAVALIASPGRANPSATSAAGPLNVVDAPITEAVSVDPEGDGSERDDLLAMSFDGNPNSTWRTESYDSRIFDGLDKSGVGIAWKLDATYRLSSLNIESNTADWSAKVFVVSDLNPETFNPLAPAIAEVKNSPEGTTTVDLKGVEGNTVILWITDLGEPDGKARVSISETTIRGESVG